VLQAYVMGTGEEVFCLDMGEPVKIVDLARDLIELTSSSFAPPIEIRFAGVRQGEKLYEELFFGSEEAAPTVHPKVLGATGTQLDDALITHLRGEMGTLLGSPGVERLREMIDSLVDDFRSELAEAAQAGSSHDQLKGG